MTNLLPGEPGSKPPKDEDYQIQLELQVILSWLDREENEEDAIREHSPFAPSLTKHGRAARLLRHFRAKLTQAHEEKTRLLIDLEKRLVLMGKLPGTVHPSSIGGRKSHVHD